MGKETELIKQKIGVADLLRSYITLFPAGKNFKALCPFHQEKTPSFIVSPDRQTWHCFGCGEGGDIFKFIMRYENLEFPEALRFLAEKAGIPIQTLSPTQQREFGVLYDMHADAAKFFNDALKKHIPAQEYLKKRKLSESTIEEFSIGFAPGGDSLSVYLMNKGFDIQDIARAGLAYKTNRGLYRDRFEQRIVFPIFNAVGKIVAFTGRIIGPESDTSPKYMNSPETQIFNKSKILYGFSHAKRAIVETHTAFLVEGQMDFLMAWQSGVKNAIAVSGTALTKDHLEKLRRIADTVVVSFDNDTAGFRALERGIEIFGSFDFHVKAMRLGKYKDPAEACENDPEFLKGAIETAEPAFQFLLERYFTEKNTNDVSLSKRIVRHLLEMVMRIKSPLEKERWIKEMAKKADIRESTLNEELLELEEQKNKKGEKEEETPEPKKKEEVSRTRTISERLLLLAFTDPEFSSILKTSHGDIFSGEYLKTLESGEAGGDEKTELLKMKATHEFSEIPKSDLAKEFKELIRQLMLEHLRIALERTRKELKKAAGNEELLKKTADEFHAISKKINELQKNAKEK